MSLLANQAASRRNYDKHRRTGNRLSTIRLLSWKKGEREKNSMTGSRNSLAVATDARGSLDFTSVPFSFFTPPELRGRLVLVVICVFRFSLRTKNWQNNYFSFSHQLTFKKLLTGVNCKKWQAFFMYVWEMASPYKLYTAKALSIRST